MRKFILLCVLYNKKCDESETIESFYSSNYSLSKDNTSEVELHVWDNSTDSIIFEYNKKYCNDNDIHHHFNGNNEFLSVVYNKFLHEYNSDFILIFDDDSNVSNEYLDGVTRATKDVEFYVGVPKVISQLGSIYSPAKFGLVKGKHINDVSCGFHSGLVAISSGMVLNCKKVISEKISFDEKLNLYGIDTDFFLCLARKGIPLYVFDVNISHDLSVFNIESKNVKRRRFLNLIKSNVYIAKKRSNFHLLLFLLYIPLVVIKNIRLFTRKSQ